MTRAALLLRKDLRILRRSPLLLGVLLAYPLLVAALVGLVAGYASAKPRVALVDEDGLPAKVTIAGKTFHVERTIREVSRNVRLVRLDAKEARRELRTGRIVASITVPPGFIDDLRSTVHSPRLVLDVTKGGITPRVTQQVQALVYTLNRLLQRAYIKANIGYVRLILRGGSGTFLGRKFVVLGLDRAQRALVGMHPASRAQAVEDFVRVARLALAQTDDALRATANPITLVEAKERGRTWILSAQVQAYALALTIAFLTLVIAAAMLAAERDENAIGRLARGLASLGELVAAKVALAALVALAIGLTIAVVFGIVVQVGGVVGGEPWARLPLLAFVLLIAGAALGAVGTLLGALAREARTASLVALLVVLPIVFVGLVPREIAPVAGYVSDGLPFVHAVRAFGSVLYDASPWGATLRELAWLVGLGGVFVALSRVAVRRLLA
jgi:ABC-2 type transport system permease protein